MCFTQAQTRGAEERFLNYYILAIFTIRYQFRSIYESQSFVYCRKVHPKVDLTILSALTL